MKIAEKVLPGHPDKMADTISDWVLDYILYEDMRNRGAIEVLISSGPVTNVIIAGETTAVLDENDLKKIVYNVLGTENFRLINLIGGQSGEIAKRVVREKTFAGDQGVVVGYATNETDEMLPLEYAITKEIAHQMNFCAIPPYQTRDGKVLTTLVPGNNAEFVVSWCHAKGAEKQTKDLLISILGSVCDKYGINDYQVIINPPDGSWTYGGPQADTGLTGRKIIADAYGSRVPHGGGAFSGKDFSKVDRSGAYWARYLARRVVALKMADWCEIKLTYGMGMAHPLNVDILSNKNYYDITDWVEKEVTKYDVDVVCKLLYRNYGHTWGFYDLGKFGHFGNNSVATELPWEQ